MVLDCISLDVIISETVEVLKRNVIRNDREGTEKSVVASRGSLLGDDKPVVCSETTRGSQTKTAARGKQYSKRGRIMMGSGWLHKLHLPLTCKQILRNVLNII